MTSYGMGSGGPTLLIGKWRRRCPLQKSPIGARYGPKNSLQSDPLLPVGRRRTPDSYLIKKSSFVRFMPFISARIQFGSIPRPVHLSLLSFLDWYFGAGFARFPVRGTRITALTAAPALLLA